jgi:Dolichyl-phosphate-mannose-protein mannosyltransferase
MQGRAAGVPEPHGRRWDTAVARVTLRRHWLFALLFALGLVLRIMVQVAYWPAILYYDSPFFVSNAYLLNPAGRDPLGYSLAARILLGAFHDLAALSAFNHLLGLSMAGLIYAVLLRRGVRPWMAALATAPVLLDGFQLLIEQMVMSDPLLQFFVVLGIALLLWRRRPDLVTAGAAGLSFACAALTRSFGQSLVVAGLLFCLLAAGRRIARRAVTAAALVLAFALPMVGYAAYNNQVHGNFALPSQAASRRLYARVAASVTCSRLTLPAYERPLCPPPGTVRPKSGSLIAGYAQGSTSPLVTYRPPQGEATSQVLRDFIERAVRQQPLAVARSVGGSLLRPFLSWSRTSKPGELPMNRWQFRPTFPLFTVNLSLKLFHRWGGYRPVANHQLAWLLRGYQLSLGYTPGLVLLACVILALAAGLGIGRARHSGQQLACLLWLTAGLGLVFAASLYLFSWRYQLPTLVTIPPAAALGLSALTSPRPRHGPPPRVQEDLTDLVPPTEPRGRRQPST